MPDIGGHFFFAPFFVFCAILLFYREALAHASERQGGAAFASLFDRCRTGGFMAPALAPQSLCEITSDLLGARR